jgi:hypothetical protein
MKINFQIALFTFIVAIIILVFGFRRKERFQGTWAGDHPSKCYSCEASLPPQYAWMGQKTKCFSCERDAIRQACERPNAGFDAHPIRYYTALPGTSANLGRM